MTKQTPEESGKQAEFGSYLFDLQTGELRRSGIRLRLESQPALVLAQLLEAGGNLVTRSQLIEVLWPGEVVGDFDRRLDKAVAKLRASLNDEPVKPQYVETLKGRGYRFIHPVSMETSKPRPQSAAALPEQAPVIESQAAPHTGGDAVDEIPRSPRIRFGRFPAAGIAGAVAAAMVVAALLSWRPHRNSRYAQGQKPVTLLLPFQEVRGGSKSTDDEWVAHALTEWLSQDLNAGGELRLLQGDKNVALAAVSGTTCKALPSQAVGSLDEPVHPDLIVYGDFSATEAGSSEDRWRLNVCLEDTRHPGDTEPILVIGQKEDIATLVLSAGDLLRSRLGLKHLSDQSLGYLRAALPSNPAAARLYTEGTLALDRFEPEDAVALLSKAEELEPDHAATHAELSTAWASLGYQKRAVQEARLAQEAETGLSPEGQLEYEGLAEESRNDSAAASETYLNLVQLRPDSIIYGLKLAHAQTNAAHPLLAIETIRRLRGANQAAQGDPRVDLAEARADAVASDFRDEFVLSTRAEGEATTAGATLLIADARMEQGRADEKLSKYHEALELFQAAQERYEQLDDRAGITDSLNSQGELLWTEAQRDRSIAVLSRSLQLSQSSGDQYREAKALTELGAIWKSTERQPDGGMPKAVAMLRHAAEIYHQIGNDAEEGYVLSVIGDVAIQQTHYEEARALYMRAMQLSEASNDKSRIAGRLLDLGIVDEWEGQNREAIRYFHDATEKFEQLGQSDRAAIVGERLGQVLFFSGNIDEAESTLQQSLIVLRSLGRENESREALGMLADVETVKNPEKAEELAKENLALNRSLGWDTSFCYASLAEAFYARGDLKGAAGAIHQAFLLPTGQKELPQEFFPFMLMYRGDVEMGNHRYAAAAADFEHALRLEKERHRPYFELAARLRLAELHILEKRSSANVELDRVKYDADQSGYGIVGVKINQFKQSL